jgi:ABC-type polar amino acid transport system ATPase subunit
MAQLAREGATMIVVTHEMAGVKAAADAVHFMGSGNFIEIGPPSQVLDPPSDPRTRQFLERFLSSPNRVPRQ